MFSIKMRASKGGEHISGAERIAPPDSAPEIASAMARRALFHSKGRPDHIFIKLESLDASQCVHVTALTPSARACATSREGLAIAAGLLSSIGITGAHSIIDMLLSAPPMRGAMLVDAGTLRRLDKSQERGVRATLMDASQNDVVQNPNNKNHYIEALVLASKVASAPGIVGEICISDDPDYVTGYVASKAFGYVRIQKMKEHGLARGGRIFLFDGPDNLIDPCITYLEKQPVLINGLSPEPPFGAANNGQKWDFIDARMEEIRQKHLLRKPCPPAGEMISLASSDYLALGKSSNIRLAAEKALTKNGAGSTGSRLTTGTWPEHLELEKALAELCGSEKALLFNSGYAANTGTIPAVCGKGDVIFSDELNHASIIDGCRLSGAEIVIYKHGDMVDLEKKLSMRQGKRGLIVSDALFSMDGDLAPMEAIAAMAEKYGFLSMLDEAHALGTIFPCATAGKQIKADIITGSLSKAAGCHGGYVSGCARLVEYLQNTARTFIFASALPAFCAAGALHALKSITPELVRQLQHKKDLFCSFLTRNGLPVTSPGPIVPIITGNENKTMLMAEKLKEEGILVSAIRFPAVPCGRARLRLVVTLNLSDEELEYAAKKITSVIKAQTTS